MVKESKSELEKLLIQGFLVELEERSVMAVPTEIQVVHMVELDPALFKKLCEERTFGLLEKVVLECEVSILNFEDELVRASSQEKELEHKASLLEGCSYQ